MKTGKKTKRRICVNYAKPCRYAGHCDNCRNRYIKSTYANGEPSRIVGCKLGYDTEGDHSKCFDCVSEKPTCKIGID